jgi:hypothetical protein
VWLAGGRPPLRRISLGSGLLEEAASMRTTLAGGLALLAVVPQLGAAQTLNTHLRLGAAVSTLPGFPPGYNASSRTGLQSGVGVTLRLAPVLAVQLQVQYTQKGARIGDGGVWLDYVEVPVLLRLSLPRRVVGTTVSALFGVAPAHEVRCGYRGIPPNDMLIIFPVPPPVQDLDCSLLRSHLNDLGVVAGVAVERAVPAGYLTLELQFNRGTRNIAAPWRQQAISNRSLALLLGYGITLVR